MNAPSLLSVLPTAPPVKPFPTPKVVVPVQTKMPPPPHPVSIIKHLYADDAGLISQDPDYTPVSKSPMPLEYERPDQYADDDDLYEDAATRKSGANRSKPKKAPKPTLKQLYYSKHPDERPTPKHKARGYKDAL